MYVNPYIIVAAVIVLLAWGAISLWRDSKATSELWSVEDRIAWLEGTLNVTEFDRIKYEGELAYLYVKRDELIRKVTGELG